MTTTLITGANKGLGFETARQLIAAGHTVYIGCRDAERGRRAADELAARLVQLDVTDDESVHAAAKAIAADGRLDALVNNAGIEGRTADGGVVGAADTTADLMRTLFETNTLGVVRVTHAFLPLLQRSPAPVVVNQNDAAGVLTGRWRADGAARRFRPRRPPATESGSAVPNAPRRCRGGTRRPSLGDPASWPPGRRT